MAVRSLFATRFYEDTIGDPGLIAELENAAIGLSEDDRAGRAWSRAHGYRGYTSYGSLNDLPHRDPAFAALARKLDRHVASFADACAFDLGGRRLKLDSLWVNVMKPGGTHSGHVHPHSVVSGTVYVAIPGGAGALKLEDPRLGLMMAAPHGATTRPPTSRPSSMLIRRPEPCCSGKAGCGMKSPRTRARATGSA